MSKWEFEALPMGDDLFKDGKVISSFSEAELILNIHDRLVKLVKDAKKMTQSLILIGKKKPVMF